MTKNELKKQLQQLGLQVAGDHVKKTDVIAVLKKITAETPLHEMPASLEDAWNKVEHLDSYFIDCAESGQGINTKEVAWMMKAMTYIIKNKGMGAALEINDRVESPEAKRIARQAVLKEFPGLDKFFSPA